MDNRIYILPIVSIIIISMAFLYDPSFTGQVIGDSEVESLIDAKIRVSVNDGIIPEDAVIIVTLANETSEMGIGEFIRKTGKSFQYSYGSIPEIYYEGYGYEGPAEYTLDLREFDLEMTLSSGEYVLTNSVYYKDTLLSYSEEVVRV